MPSTLPVPGSTRPDRCRDGPADRSRSALAAAAAAGLLATVACGGSNAAGAGPAPPSSAGQEGVSRDDLPPDAVEVMARNLDTPWEVRFLPGGGLLVTERRGTLLRLSAADGAGDVPYGVAERHEIPDVRERGEAGLMGLALHPEFPETPWIYVCHTHDGPDGPANRVVRFRYADGSLSGRRVMMEGIPGAAVHDGCRLEFGPDGMLYVTTGDAGDGADAQDRDSPAGKIHRLTDAGEAAPDNPFGSTVWSLGHRNPQGLAFDERGRLWATEHGPSGMRSGRDEVNRIRRGANYGWPHLTGSNTSGDMVPPVLHSGAHTWAPAGLAASGSSLFFGGLRGAALYELRGALDEGTDLELVAHFRGEYGRIRAVRTGPDGRVWFGTSNRDGRGSPAAEDDRLLRIDPSALSTTSR